MRPKKVVLLMDSDETTQSTTRFLLEVKGYRVHSAATAEQALEIAAAVTVNVILLRDRGRSPQLSSLALDLKERCDAPLMFISQYKESRADDPCYDFIQWEHATPTEFIERVKLFTARKRGPIPTSLRKAVQSVRPCEVPEYMRWRA